MLESILVAGGGDDAKRVELAAERVGIDQCAAPEDEGSLEEVLGAAERTGAKSIYRSEISPAERVVWAKAARDKGLVYVGPSEASLALLANKIGLREHAAKMGQAVIPGSQRPIESLKEAQEDADRLGFPLFLKPNAGAGNHGVLRVEAPRDLGSAYETCAAVSAERFGSPALLLESAVDRARQLELTILVSDDKQSLTLIECESSLRDERGALISEMPSPFFGFRLDGDELREGLRELVVSLATSMELVGAMTVEFLIDTAGKCWFLEANAGTGIHGLCSQLLLDIDPVEQELRIAGGEPVMNPRDVRPFGHSVQVRLAHPSPGSASAIPEIVFPPSPIRESRVERANGIASQFHARVAGHGATRHRAVLALDRILAETRVEPSESNRDRLREVMNHESFRAGQYDRSLADVAPPTEPAPAAS